MHSDGSSSHRAGLMLQIAREKQEADARHELADEHSNASRPLWQAEAEAQGACAITCIRALMAGVPVEQIEQAVGIPSADNVRPNLRTYLTSGFEMWLTWEKGIR